MYSRDGLFSDVGVSGIAEKARGMMASLRAVVDGHKGRWKLTHPSTLCLSSRFISQIPPSLPPSPSLSVCVSRVGSSILKHRSL